MARALHFEGPIPQRCGTNSKHRYQEQANMMVNTRRFGDIEIEPREVLHFPVGIAGFPDERAFILVRTKETGTIAWLQSARTPSLALPLVSAHAFGSSYPDVPFEPIAERAGIGSDAADMAM